ncbi:YqaA family protein [Geobacter argillaceus]|uniref:Membrane protein YqaA with SNARE-associated domain n=1 Tax=Geobacter argillaceus TaxID=345631 RepID=A0A562VLU2_9BACT|nr:hypothetical protein [Geobacter argillaceus]TWJ18858.1 hypothetical protein JN12_02309 [Geobacter argillaceus]
MEHLVGTYGYLALFAVSFLAATLLPLGSEWLLVGGILKVPFARFSLLVLAGKSARYAVVAYLTIQGANLLKPLPIHP